MTANPRYCGDTGDCEKTPEADVVLENRDQKYADKGAEFADSGGYAMSRGAHAHRKDLRGKAQMSSGWAQTE